MIMLCLSTFKSKIPWHFEWNIHWDSIVRIGFFHYNMCVSWFWIPMLCLSLILWVKAVIFPRIHLYVVVSSPFLLIQLHFLMTKLLSLVTLHNALLYISVSTNVQSTSRGFFGQHDRLYPLLFPYLLPQEFFSGTLDVRDGFTCGIY